MVVGERNKDALIGHFGDRRSTVGTPNWISQKKRVMAKRLGTSSVNLSQYNLTKSFDFRHRSTIKHS